MSFLSQVLGLSKTEAFIFDGELSRLEKKAQQAGIDLKLSGKIKQNSATILRELGFIGSGVLKQEVVAALKNRLKHDLKTGDKANKLWRKYRYSVVLATDGMVSANIDDVKLSLTRPSLSYKNVRKAIIEELAEKYSQKISYYTKDEIIEKLTNV